MDRAASCYPELHFNRSTLFQYEEMYGSALAGYSRATELDPGWKEPPEREKQLLEYLEKVTELLQNKVGDSLQKYRHTVYVLLQKRTEKKSVKIML